ncbi:hypothetical protein, partial [Escherichia coli]|uniref:hypothetical protein n=1 Tax=Escherichia coli TaxID=562 RepID=UPI0021517DEE
FRLALNRRKCGGYRKIQPFFARDRSPLLLILWTYRSGMSFVWLIAGKLSEIAAIRTHPP